MKRTIGKIYGKMAYPLFAFSLFSLNQAFSYYAYVANQSSTSPGTVSVINTSTNQVVSTVAVDSNPYDVAITLDGAYTYVTCPSYPSVWVINNADNSSSSLTSVSITVPIGIAIASTPNGINTFIVNQGGGGPGTLDIFDSPISNLINSVTVGIGPVDVAISPDGYYAYVTNQSAVPGTVSVIDTSTYNVIATVTVGTGPAAVAFTPVGAYAYVTNQADTTVSVINTSTYNRIATVTVGLGPIGVAITINGAYAYVANGNSTTPGTVSVINTATNTVITTVSVGSNPKDVAMTSDGAFCYVTNREGAQGIVSVINLFTNHVVATVNVGSDPLGIAIGTIGYTPPSPGPSGQNREFQRGGFSRSQ